jgi:hypothetical protein
MSLMPFRRDERPPPMRIGGSIPFCPEAAWFTFVCDSRQAWSSKAQSPAPHQQPTRAPILGPRQATPGIREPGAGARTETRTRNQDPDPDVVSVFRIGKTAVCAPLNLRRLPWLRLRRDLCVRRELVKDAARRLTSLPTLGSYEMKLPVAPPPPAPPPRPEGCGWVW